MRLSSSVDAFPTTDDGCWDDAYEFWKAGTKKACTYVGTILSQTNVKLQHLLLDTRKVVISKHWKAIPGVTTTSFPILSCPRNEMEVV